MREGQFWEAVREFNMVGVAGSRKWIGVGLQRSHHRGPVLGGAS